MASESLNKSRTVFDELTSEMSQIAQDAQTAPPEHGELYQRALLESYATASEFLELSPELIGYFGVIALYVEKTSDEDLNRFASARRLKKWAELGLLDDADLELLGDRPVPEWSIYTKEDLAVFQQLFSRVPQITKTVAEAPQPEEQPQAEADDDGPVEEEINLLDVLEHLEKHGLDPAQLAVVQAALSPSPMTLEELRKKVWQVIVLTPEEYSDLGFKLEHLRAVVSQLLSKVHYPNRWVRDPKGKAFQLLVGKAAERSDEDTKTSGLSALYGGFKPDVYARMSNRREASSSRRKAPAPEPEIVPVPVPEEVILPEPIPEPSAPGPTAKEQALVFREAANFSQKLLWAAVQSIKNNPRLNSVINDLSEIKGSGLSRLEIRDGLLNLIESGNLFFGANQKGSRTLSLTKVETAPSRNPEAFDKNPGDPKERDPAFTIEELIETSKVFQALIGVKYQNKGLPLRDLINQLGAGEAGRRTIRRLVGRGLLISVIGFDFEMSNSPKSRRKSTTFIRLPSQSAWHAFKADPNKYVACLDQPSIRAVESDESFQEI